MKTPLRAMIWELWRTSRNELTIRTALMVAAVAVIHYGSSSMVRPGGPEAQVIHGVVLMALTMASAASSNWLLQLDRHSTGFSFRLGFARPVSTSMLVIVPMLYTSLSAVLCFLIPASLLNLVSGADLPLINLAIIVICVESLLMTVTWSPSTTIGKLTGFAGLAVGLLGALVAFHAQSDSPDPILMSIGNPDYYGFGWQHYLTFLALFCAAIGVTTVAVNRQRHGDQWLLWNPWRARKKELTRRRISGRAFRNCFEAQCWYEAKRFGPSVLGVALFAAVLMMVFAVVASLLYSVTDSAPFVWVGVLALCPIVYQLVGADGAIGLKPKQGAVQFSSFDAIRPMTNDMLIVCKLIVVAICSIIGWCFMLIAAVIYTATTNTWATWYEIGQFVSTATDGLSIFWWLALISNILFLYISSCSSLLAFGLWLPKYPRLFIVGAIFGYTSVVLGVIDHKHDLNLSYLWFAYRYLIPIGIVCLCFVALKKAISSRYLGRRSLACWLILWLIFVPSIIALYAQVSHMISVPQGTLFAAAAWLFVPLASTAIAPLALASHRHA